MADVEDGHTLHLVVRQPPESVSNNPGMYVFSLISLPIDRQFHLYLEKYDIVGML
jgi:hypothetical protein